MGQLSRLKNIRERRPRSAAQKEHTSLRWITETGAFENGDQDRKSRKVVHLMVELRD